MGGKGSGRKPKPLEEHEGRPPSTRYRYNQQASGHIGPAPQGLGKHALKLWCDIVNYCPDGMLSGMDATQLERACRLHERAMALEEAQDMSPAYFKLLSAVNSLLGEFGATPLRRQRIMVPRTKGEDTDELSEFLKTG